MTMFTLAWFSFLLDPPWLLLSLATVFYCYRYLKTELYDYFSMANNEPSRSITTPRESIAGVPDFGWRVKLDYECPEKCKPFTTPRLSQLPALVGLGLRYGWYMLKCRRQGRRPHMDHVNPVNHRPIYGCPIGGIGCGSIGRGYRGEFCRFQMVPGMYDYHVVPGDQFIVCIRRNGQTVYQKVLTGSKPKKCLKAWEWGFPHDKAIYHALYPRAWTIYNIPEQKIRLICRQVSPVIPHDYKESTLPTALFVWSVENSGSEPADVSIVFTFQNGRGMKEDRQGGVWNEPFQCDSEGREVKGVAIHQTFNDMACTYAIAGATKDGVHMSHKVHFDPLGTGADLWEDLREDGRLGSSQEPTGKTVKGQETAAAICLQCSVAQGEKKELEIALVWDMPIIHFRSKELKYARRYTRWFGREGDAAPTLCSYALHKYTQWEEQIETWQKPVLNCKQIPAWYKSCLFNELYYISDSGSVWVDPMENTGPVNNKGQAHIREYSKFAYLEGQEYRMYNTYDVHHYASFALIVLFPNIQLSIQYDMADIVKGENLTQRTYCMHGTKGNRKTAFMVPHDVGDPADIIKHENLEQRVYCMEGMRGNVKTRNMVPHDIGDPEDEPWLRVNAYNIHPTDNWKDLNLKFVMQVYRDYYFTKDREYMEYMYPLTRSVMEAALEWDVDEDGLVDNGGFADQTYDAWIMHGASAYCGGLWLCALRMFTEMAKLLNDDKEFQKFDEILKKGKESYEKKLWNGKYYNYDCSSSGYHDSIMADQLNGHWFLRASGLDDYSIFPEDHVHTCLQTIFESNVMGFANGNMGAINGTRPNGKKDISSCQAEEFWVGVTYGLAAQMIQEGMLEKGFKTAWGNYNVCWEWLGLAFQTPEAYQTSKHYRSLGYMRPLAVWAMQWALEKFHPHLFKS